jgi:hypothetical protein
VIIFNIYIVPQISFFTQKILGAKFFLRQKNPHPPKNKGKFGRKREIALKEKIFEKRFPKFL